jgi:hypothetical protein
MSFISWLQDCRTFATREHARRSNVKQRGLRPRLEPLEGRALLSTLTVTNTLDSGIGSLRYEIAQAETEKHHGGKAPPANDTIVFAPSLAGQTITLTSGELDITTGLTIQGPGTGQLTISGGNNSRVFEVNASAPVVLSGLTISNGIGVVRQTLPDQNDGYGGGILNLSTLTLSGCVVSGNSVGGATGRPLSGGGIYNAGNLTLTGCTISNNSALGTFYTPGGVGGGIYNAGTLTVSTSTVSGNAAYDGYYGGGIYNAGTLTVSTSTFNSNWIDPNGTYIENNIYGTYTDGGGNTFS